MKFRNVQAHSEPYSSDVILQLVSLTIASHLLCAE
jgi:hypothetical protein